MKKKRWSPMFVLVIVAILVVAYPLSSCRRAEQVPAVQETAAEETMQEPADPNAEIPEPVREPAKEEPAKETVPKESAPVIQSAFIYAILKGVDWDKAVLKIEQLEGGPNEPQVGQEIALAPDYSTTRSVLIRKADSEAEYGKPMKLGQVPKGSEIGIVIRDSKAHQVIYQQFIDAQMQSPRMETAAGESFVYAVYKGFDDANQVITIEQLLSGSSDPVVGDTLVLAQGYQVQLIIVERVQGQENEYVKDIRLQDVGIHEEIGIVLTPDGKARGILLSISVE